jgi:CubicO group peptidase (beta-lactamase class C family)
MSSRTHHVLLDGITRGLHSGAQVYVSLQGRTILDEGVGELRPGTPMTRDSITLWMSASKPLAAICLAMLWEKGKLALDDPVVKFIPEFAAGGKDAITLRHLLTHTGGFRGPMNNYSNDSWEKIIERICAMKLEPGWIPGKKAGYHVATSWFILGEIIQRIDGRPYNEFVRQLLLEPLGCSDSWVGMPADFYEANRDCIAPMYSTNPAAKAMNTTMDSQWECAMVAPGANGRGPIRELGKVYEWLSPSPLAGEGRGEGKASASNDAARSTRSTPHPNPLPQGEREVITTRHRVGMMDMTFRHIIDWGLGFIIDSKHYNQPTLPYGYGPHASPRTFGHSGNQSSCAFCDPEVGLVAAWMCNGMPGEERHFARQNAINAAIYEDAGLATRP